MKRQDRFKAIDFVTDTGGKNRILSNERIFVSSRFFEMGLSIEFRKYE